MIVLLLVGRTGRRFRGLARRFDFDILTPTEACEKFSTGDTESLVYSYVLTLRSPGATS
jgi:hypothetical protein